MEIKTSVIMSVYNGSLYLGEQLDSIVNQTLIPDEIIVLNDCSNDCGKTERVIDSYVAKYSFVKKINNESNMGWRASFMKGCRIAQGEYIFFADQDDVWVKEKIEKMVSSMEKIGANVMISHCCNTNNDMEPISEFHENRGVKENNFPFSKKFMEPIGVGAAMVFRRSFINEYIGLWQQDMGHDRFFQVVARLFDRIYYYDETLIFHRMHDNNATGKRNFNIQARIITSKGDAVFCENLLDSDFSKKLSPKQVRIIKRFIRFSIHRNKMLSYRSFIMWLLLPVYDLKFYSTWKTWFGDLVAIRREKNDFGVY
ncbi:MAG: glycosyltransferase [Oliverpabstia sp.]|nr:glycosyltransferase [Oliverpabstia sp.]